MLNWDYVTYYNFMQKSFLTGFLISVALQPITAIVGIITYIIRKQKYWNYTIAAILFPFFLWGFFGLGMYDNTILGFIGEIGLYPLRPEKLLGSFEPIRLTISTGYLILLNLIGYIYLDPIDQAMIKQEKMEKEKQIVCVKQLPEVDPKVKEHATIIATTGTGKSTLLRQDHIIPALQWREQLIIVSGKAGREEKYGLLQTTIKLCKRYGRGITVISMDPNMKNSKKYNPFQKMGKKQIVDVLNEISPFSEKHYESAFRSWIETILELMEIAEIPFSLPMILMFFKWEDFELRLREIAKEKELSREEIEEFLSAREDAETAKGSYTRLKELCSKPKNKKNTKDKKIKEVEGIITIKGTNIINELKKGNVIFFDLDAEMYQKYTQQIGAMIIFDIRNTIARYRIPDNRRCKVILDEVGYFATEEMDVLYTQARSKNYQIISAFQDTTKIERRFPKLINTILGCSNIMIFGRLMGPDAALVAEHIGSRDAVDTTRKAEFGGLDGSETGSKRNVNKFNIHPDTLRNLENLEFVYINWAREKKLYKVKIDPTKQPPLLHKNKKNIKNPKQNQNRNKK